MLADSTDSFRWPTRFSCVLIRDNLLLVNHYNISILMSPEPTDQESVRLGFRKLKHFISGYLDNSVIINTNNPVVTKLDWLHSNTIHVPNDPHDYFLASILFQKFSSIVKEFFSIAEIAIDSRLGDSVEYKINHANQELAESTNWWSQDSVNTNDIDQFPTWDDLKIIPLSKFEPKIVIGGRGETR
jgi:hypothetical protein